MRTLIAIAALLLSGSVFAQPEIPADKDVVVFEGSKLGKVTFHHREHSLLTGVDCRTCHHTYEGQGPIKECHECHVKGSTTAPPPQKAFHLRCAGCHEYTVKEGKEAGPLPKKCKLCHVKDQP